MFIEIFASYNAVKKSKFNKEITREVDIIGANGQKIRVETKIIYPAEIEGFIIIIIIAF